jgi:hypothetical protein
MDKAAYVFEKKAISFEKNIGPAILKRIKTLKAIKDPSTKAVQTQKTMQQIRRMDQTQRRFRTAEQYLAGQDISPPFGKNLTKLLGKMRKKYPNVIRTKAQDYRTRTKVKWPEANNNVDKLNTLLAKRPGHGSLELTNLKQMDKEKSNKFLNDLRNLTR